jgi:pimeloyl-ACP methyl ester carboxylesterase
MQLASGGTEIFYEMTGDGPPLVLLHPFPVHHEFWNALLPSLGQRYRLLLPDLRCHGRSGWTGSAATMEQHAGDLATLLDANQIKQAFFCGVSIGGYVLFEFWRRYRDRVRALVLCDTRAQADTPEGRTHRLAAVAEIEKKGADDYLDGMVPKLLGETTRRSRPDQAAHARQRMAVSKPAGICAALRGMAERPDSVPTLKTISVPTLIVVGEEDTLTPPPDAELMAREISGSRLLRIPRAGHYAPFEQPEKVVGELRKFLDPLAR